eukprot:4100583-Pyramimonas_sp.AAC.1
MKASTGQGVDFLSPVDLERLPDTALAELALLFTACEACLCWPGQLLLILGGMLPKKVQGDRIIGLVPLLGRLWSLIREPLVRGWSAETEERWDAAARGNSSVREAHLRAIQGE